MGVAGAEKRVDVVAALMQKRGTVYDLEEAELCYGEVLDVSGGFEGCCVRV